MTYDIIPYIRQVNMKPIILYGKQLQNPIKL